MQLRTCWCFGFLVLLASFLAGFLIWPSGSAQAQQVYPNCNFRCPANDVTITDAYAEVADSTCYFGQLVSTSIYVTFFNRANSSRYGVYFIADLYVDGAFVQHFDDCILDVVAPGTTTVLLISSVISCSENVEFRNVIVSWSQKTGGCGVPPECQERGAKCWMPPGSIVRVSRRPRPNQRRRDLSTDKRNGVGRSSDRRCDLSSLRKRRWGRHLRVSSLRPRWLLCHGEGDRGCHSGERLPHGKGR